MLSFYNGLLRLLVPVILVRLLWRGLRNRGYWYRWGERFGCGPRLTSGRRVLWIHAVSVGEVRAAVPLVRALQDQYPEHTLLITTMTPTGSAQVRALFDATVEHCYVPYDLPSAVERFLDRAHPEVAVIMETELWPNLFHACARRHIPLCVANVRMSEASMRGYRKVARLTCATLAQVTRFGVQTQADAARVKYLGAPESAITVTGSIKFELKLPASLRESAEVLRHEWGWERPIWIAASTHPGEDEMVLEAYARLKTRSPRLLLVLVPRHPERFSLVAKMVRKAGLHTVLRSEQVGGLAPDTEVLLGDTMGELQLFFGATDVAFIGGSLVPTGGHNVLEACALGVPVVFGPHMFNFHEIATMTRERGAGRQVNDADSLAAAVADYLENANARFEAGEAGKRMVAENRGALERTLTLLQELIPA